MSLEEFFLRLEGFVRGIPKSRVFLLVTGLIKRARRFLFEVFVNEFEDSDFEKFVHETHRDCQKRVEREHGNRSRWFVMAMLDEQLTFLDDTMGLATWGNSAPVSFEAHRHIISLMHKMRRTGLISLWGDGMDKRHKALMQYFIILMLNYNNTSIPKECLDIGEFFRNLMNYKLTKYDIESFDEFLSLNGVNFQYNLMTYFMRLRHRCLVGLSSLPSPYESKGDLLGKDDSNSRINYRLVINYEGHPVFFTTYSKENKGFEKFMRILFELKKRFKMRRMYFFGDTNELWTHEPNVISEVRYRDMPLSLERNIEDLYRRRHLSASYYEHQNYEFTLTDPTTVMGRRMVIFNQPELVIERREYRAQKILELSTKINEINQKFRKLGNLSPKAMFVELYQKFGIEEIERLRRFLMVSFHDEHGLYLVVDKLALRTGSVVDKLCVTNTTTSSEFLEIAELGLVGRNFIRNRIFFETDFLKKYKMIVDLGIRRKVSINSILLFSSFLRHYLLYMIY